MHACMRVCVYECGVCVCVCACACACVHTCVCVMICCNVNIVLDAFLALNCSDLKLLFKHYTFFYSQANLGVFLKNTYTHLSY